MRTAFKAQKPLGGPRDPRHGKYTTYKYWACRCERCREANTEYHREQRASSPVTNHGRAGYDKGCRCDTCVSGRRRLEREKLARNREWRAEHQMGKAVKADLGGLA
jgi:hypothetical protein